MSLEKFLEDNPSSSNVTRGLISGFLGGLAGTLVKSTVERFLDVRKIDQKSAQIKALDDLSTKIIGTPIDAENEAVAEQLVNVPLGASVGAAYGYGKRDEDEINILDGAMLGASTWASTHTSTFPLMGVEKSPDDIPLKTQVHELFAHALFGITTEVVRSVVSKRLKDQ